MSIYKDNYFERQKARGRRSRYRFYLWDYLFYCGEKYRKKKARTHGATTILFYWYLCVMLPLHASPTRLAEFLNSNLILSLSIDIGLPVIFCMVRYRKKRTAAIMNHFSRNSSLKGIHVGLVSMGWFPLFIIELVIMKALGWG